MLMDIRGESPPSFCNGIRTIYISRRGKTGRSGRVNWVCGSIGSRVKRVIFKRVNQVTSQLGRGLCWVELTCIFQKVFFFFFFEIDAICHLFMSSLTVIRF